MAQLDRWTLNEWLQASDLSDSIQRRIAPGPTRGAIPKGKIDYKTALAVTRQIKDPEKAAEVVEHIAEKHTQSANEETFQTAKRPEP